MQKKTALIIAALIAIALVGAKFATSDDGSANSANGGFGSKDPKKAAQAFYDQLPKNNPVIR